MGGNASQTHEALVVGSGALGAGLAALLIRAGWHVGWLGRFGVPLTTLQVRGLPDFTGDVELPLAPESRDCPLFLVGVKAPDLREALSWIAGVAKPGAAVVALGNGMLGTELDEFSTSRLDVHWRLGMTTLAVSRVGENSYEWRNDRPSLVWGPRSGEIAASPVSSEVALSAALGKWSAWQRDAAVSVKKKWIFNTALNSLCGVYRLPRNGLALGFSSVLRALFDEAWQLAEEILRSPYIARASKVTDENKEATYQELLQLVQATAANENSMARDVRLGMVTETDYLAGRAVGRYDFPLLKLFHGVLTIC